MSKRLLFIGDSLIEYFDWEARFPDHEVYNFGVAGETLKGLSLRLGRVLEQISSPDYLFIMSGINSLAMGHTDIDDTYRKIISGIKHSSAQSRICIHSLLPVDFPFIDNEEIRKTNLALKKIAREEGCMYLDLNSLFTGRDMKPVAGYLLEDGVHVSGKGYGVWSEEIEKLLER